MPGGRPTKYKPEYCDKLIKHIKEGYSFKSFAGRILVNPDTIYEWVKKHEEFSDAKSIGEGASLFAYEKNLQKGFKGKYEGFNGTAAVWFGKNVHGWTDKQKDDEDDKKININLNYNINE